MTNRERDGRMNNMYANGIVRADPCNARTIPRCALCRQRSTQLLIVSHLLAKQQKRGMPGGTKVLRLCWECVRAIDDAATSHRSYLRQARRVDFARGLRK